MTPRIPGIVALVTGGAAGIGEGTIRRFVAEGARCVIADLDDERGNALAEELGEAAAYVHADVRSEDDVAAAVDEAVATFGRLDCMFNNAGILGAVGPIVDTTADHWDLTIDVLLRGVFLGVKHAARVMIPQGSGVILNTASTAGVRPGLGPHAYTAAKHAIVGFTGSVAPELARHGIRTNCIAPGGVVTAMTAYAIGHDAGATGTAAARIAERSPLQRAGHVDDIANAALFLASSEATYVNGACLVVDAGGEVIATQGRHFSDEPASLGWQSGPRPA